MRVVKQYRKKTTFEEKDEYEMMLAGEMEVVAVKVKDDKNVAEENNCMG